MRNEYKLDYSQAKLNRFASRVDKNALVVVLDPDVASVFSSSKAVNSLLRAVISALPASSVASAGRKRRTA